MLHRILRTGWSELQILSLKDIIHKYDFCILSFSHCFEVAEMEKQLFPINRDGGIRGMLL